MDYSFSVEHAKKYGVDEAIFLNNLAFWIGKNKANDKHLYDGRTWSYNSARAFTRIFPFWNEKQIYRLIDKLAAMGVILKGNFSENKKDRTLWLAFANEREFLGDLFTDNEPPEAPAAQKQTQTELFGQKQQKPAASQPERQEARKEPTGEQQQPAPVNSGKTTAQVAAEVDFNNEVAEKRAFYCGGGFSRPVLVSKFTDAVHKALEMKTPRADFWACVEKILTA